MSEQLTPKFGLDIGEFKAGIAEINRSIRVIESEFRATAAGMKSWDTTSAGLEARLRALSGEIDLQKTKVAATAAMYQKIAAEQGASSRAAQDWQIKLNKETETLNRLQSELGQSQTALSKVKNEEKNASRETDTLKDKEDQATRSTGKFTDALKKLGSGLGSAVSGMAKFALSAAKVVATLAAAAAGAVGALLATTVKPASDLNETVSKVGVVFGDAADQVLRFGDDAATSLGMSKNAALTAAGTYGSMFRSLGLASGASAKMSTGLVQLAGDWASFSNLDTQEVLDKFKAGITGEYEPLKSLGIVMNASTVEARALQMGFQKVNGEFDAGALVQARYSLFLEQSTLASGDFARTSGGLANQQRILKANIENLRATIGTGLLPMLAAGAAGLNKLLGSDAVQKRAQMLSRGLEGVGRAIQAAFGGDKWNLEQGVLSAFSNIGQVFGLTSDQAAQMGATVVRALGPLGAALQRIGGYVKEFFAILSGSGGDLGKIGSGIGVLLAGIVSDTAGARIKMVEGAIGLVQGLAGGILAAIPTLMPVVTSLITGLVNSIVQAAPLLMQTGVQILLALINGIVPMLPMLLSAALQMIIALANGITQALPTLIPVIAQVIPQLIVVLLQNLPLLVQAALNLIVALVQGILAACPLVAQQAPAIVQALVGAIVAIAPMLLVAALQLMQALVGAIYTNLPMMRSAAARIVQDMVLGIIALVGDLAGAGANLIAGLWAGIKGAWAGMLKQFDDLVKLLPESIKKILGIKSPSTVFAGIGQNLALGLGVGFHRAFQGVQAEISGAVAGVGSLPVGGRAGALRPGGNSQTALARELKVTVNITGEYDIYQHGPELARLIIAELYGMA